MLYQAASVKRTACLGLALLLSALFFGICHCAALSAPADVGISAAHSYTAATPSQADGLQAAPRRPDARAWGALFARLLQPRETLLLFLALCVRPAAHAQRYAFFPKHFYLPLGLHAPPI